MKEKILIICDSPGDIPKEEAERYGIVILPVMVSCGNKTYAEFYDITPEEYWELLKSTDEIPTTAQVAPNLYLEAFRKARGEGYTHVLCMLINSKGSGTYAAGCTARELFYADCGKAMRIEMLDSRSYSYIYGQIAVHCAKMRDQGAAFEEIVQDAEDRISRVEAFLAVYNLKHLKKSGRISGGAAFVGEALGLKPISHVIDGAVTVFDKVRGDQALVPRIIEHVKKRIREPDKQTVILLYSDIPEAQMKKAEQLVMEQIGAMAVRRVAIGPSVTTNSGPHSIALAFYGEKRKA